jgi:hypothetical protein
MVTPAQPTYSLMTSHHFSASFPTTKKKEKIEKQEGVVELTEGRGGGCLSLPFFGMAESSWPTSEVTQEHLQNLISQGYMTTAEFATCLMPVDPASPTLAR